MSGQKIMTISQNPLYRVIRRGGAFATRQVKRSGILYRSRRLIGSYITRNEVFIVAEIISSNQADDLKRRLGFYLPDLNPAKIRVVKKAPLRTAVTFEATLFFGDLPQNKMTQNQFDINYLRNPMDGWDWVRLVNHYYKHKPDLVRSRELFSSHISLVKGKNLEKCYIFGTGISLDDAINRDWSDGYKIVCNTIVRDPILWNHIKPDVIVAGDAIYHFGHTGFAKEFRSDLIKRLNETQTIFAYPEMFDKIVRREMGGVGERLIPVPMGGHQNIHVNLAEEFSLPALGNVLALLLLPMGCTLSKKVMLWGFDGRAPNDNDKPFWSNSNKHTYPELMSELKTAHPRFFEHFVPKNDPLHYVKQVQGELLDERLSQAEKMGYEFVMMHHTWTPSLQKRFKS